MAQSLSLVLPEEGEELSSVLCAFCEVPILSSSSPYALVSLDGCGVRCPHHILCLPPSLLQRLCPSANYSPLLQQWPSADAALRQSLTQSLDQVLLAAYKEQQQRSLSLWWHDPDLCVDSTAAERLTCGICQHLLDRPVELPCAGAHVLCTACWWILRLSPSTGKELLCPFCREAIDVTAVHESRVTGNRISHELTVRCRALTEGCTATMTAGTDGTHCLAHERTCLPVPCPDCSSLIPTQLMSHHQQLSCFFTCSACGDRVPCSEWMEHLQGAEQKNAGNSEEVKGGEEVVPSSLVSAPSSPLLCVNRWLCPYACPSPIVPRSDYEQHITSVCPHRLVRCHVADCYRFHRYHELLQYVREHLESVYSRIVSHSRPVAPHMRVETEGEEGVKEKDKCPVIGWTGEGHVMYDNGDEYSGAFSDGRFHGYGAFWWVDGSSYEGDWVRRKREGNGKMTYTSGRVYEGTFSRGMKEGHGNMKYPSGNEYEGGWSRGRRHGTGKTWKVSRGEWEEGEWLLGKKQPKVVEKRKVPPPRAMDRDTDEQRVYKRLRKCSR